MKGGSNSTLSLVGRKVGGCVVLTRERSGGTTSFLVRCCRCGHEEKIQHPSLLARIKRGARHCRACHVRSGDSGPNRQTAAFRCWSSTRHRMVAAWRDDFAVFHAGIGGGVEGVREINRDLPLGPGNFRPVTAPACEKHLVAVGERAYSLAGAALLLGLSRKRCRQLHDQGLLVERLSATLYHRLK